MGFRSIKRDVGLSVLIAPFGFAVPLVAYAILYPVIVSRYGLAVLGLWSFLAGFGSLLAATDIGFGLLLARSAGVDRTSADSLRAKQKLLTARRFYWVVGVATSAIVTAFVPFAVSYYAIPYSALGFTFALAVFLAGTFVQLAAKLDAAVLMARQDTKSVQFVGALVPIVSFAPGIAGAMSGFPIEGLSLGHLASGIVAGAAYRRRLRRRHRDWYEMRVAIRWRTWFSRLRALIREGAHLYLISVGMVLRESLFRMVVVVTLGLEVIGIYDIALRVTRLMRQLIASGFVSLYPSFATLLRQNDRSSAAKLTRVSLFALVAVGGASLGLVSVACDVLYAIWLGLENRELVAATQILAVWQFVTLLNVPYWYLLQSAHLERNAASALWWHTASLLLLPVLTGFVTFDLQKILAYWLVTSLLTQAYIFYLVEKKLHMFWSSVSSVRVLASVGAMLACLVGTPLLDGGDLAGSSPFRLSYVAWTALVCVALAATWAPLSASLRSLQR